MAAAVWPGIELRMKVMITNMDFPGTDPHNGAILFVHLDNPERILAAQDNVIVEFIILRQGSKLGSWEVGDGTEAKAIDAQHCDVGKPADDGSVGHNLPREVRGESQQVHLDDTFADS